MDTILVHFHRNGHEMDTIRVHFYRSGQKMDKTCRREKLTKSNHSIVISLGAGARGAPHGARAPVARPGPARGTHLRLPPHVREGEKEGTKKKRKKEEK